MVILIDYSPTPSRSHCHTHRLTHPLHNDSRALVLLCSVKVRNYGVVTHAARVSLCAREASLQALVLLNRCAARLLCCSAGASLPRHQGAERQRYTSDLGALLQDGPASRLQAVLQTCPHTSLHRSLHLPAQRLPAHHHSAG